MQQRRYFRVDKLICSRGAEWRRARTGSALTVIAIGVGLYLGWIPIWSAAHSGADGTWWWPTWQLLIPVALVIAAVIALIVPIVPHRPSRTPNASDDVVRRAKWKDIQAWENKGGGIVFEGDPPDVEKARAWGNRGPGISFIGGGGEANADDDDDEAPE